MSNNDIVGRYLSGDSLQDIAASHDLTSDQILHILLGEAVKVNITDSEMLEIGIVDGRFRCSVCKRWHIISQSSTSSWLALETGRACCRLCRYKKDIRRKFDLSLEECDTLIKSGVMCAICGIKDDKRLCVDHDHKTGKVRGLLCHRCNRALGGFKDDASLLTKAADYLRTHA